MCIPSICTLCQRLGEGYMRAPCTSGQHSTQRPVQHPAAGTAPGDWHGTRRVADSECLLSPFTLLGSYREGKGF